MFFKKRIKLNSEQARLVREMANCYTEILRAAKHPPYTENAIAVEFALSNRIGEIKRELGVPLYKIDSLEE